MAFIKANPRRDHVYYNVVETAREEGKPRHHSYSVKRLNRKPTATRTRRAKGRMMNFSPDAITSLLTSLFPSGMIDDLARQGLAELSDARSTPLAETDIRRTNQPLLTRNSVKNMHQTLEREVVVRKRKLDVRILVWTMIAGFAADGEARSIAAYRRTYNAATGQNLFASSFYDRFTEQLEHLLGDLLDGVVEEVAVPHTALSS